jgi:hypothetical protein
MFQLQLFFCSIVMNGNIPIVTTRPFSLPCYLQGSENGRVVTIGKHSRLNCQIWYRHPNSEALFKRDYIGGVIASSNNKTLNARLLARVITGCHDT